MRTDARIFRVASPLGLGRCCTGGGGCWLCGGDTDMVPPLPRRSPSGPRGNGSARGRAEAQGTGRSPGRAPAGAAAPACAPSRSGGSRSRTAVLGPSPRPRLPRGRVGPGPKPQGPTSPARHLGPRHCPWSLDADQPLPGKAPWGGGSLRLLPSHTWPAHVLPVGSRGRKRGAGRQPGETSHRGAVPPPGHHLKESHSCGPQNTSQAHHVPRPAAAMPRTQRLSQTRTEPSTAPRPPESCPIPVTMPGPYSGWETEQDQKRGEEKDQKQAWATLRPVEPLPPNITALRDSPSPGSPRTPTWTSRGHRHWPSLRDSPGSEKALCPAVGGGRRSVPPPLSATLPAQYPAGSSPRSLALLSQDRGAGHPGSLRCVLKIHPVSVKAHLFRSGPPKSSLPTRDPHTSQLT